MHLRPEILPVEESLAAQPVIAQKKEEIMFKGLSPVRLIVAWFVAVAVGVAACVVLGVTITISTGVLLLAMSLAVPAVLSFVWRGDEPTVAELLHAVNTTTKDGS